MLETRAQMLGNFSFTTRRLEEQEKKYYGIFISHSSADNEKYLEPLLDTLHSRGLNPICDRDLLKGGDDFQRVIESSLDCYAGVVIVTESSLRSDWVNYEIGIFTGNGTPVYLWDPNNLLSYESKKEIDVRIAAAGDSYLGQYLPAYKSLSDIAEALANASPYSEMFNEENEFLTKKSFTESVSHRAETVIARIESNIIEEYADIFDQCKLGTLIINFGMFYPDHGDGMHCYARHCAPIANGKCPISGYPCALVNIKSLDEFNKECVLLNYISYNGALVRRGEPDSLGNKAEKSCLQYHLPVHRLFGTEFKFIIDVPDNIQFSVLINVLEEAGFNPSSSDSCNGGRIYLSLPERRGQGLFRLNNEFSNNFLCSQATREAKVIPYDLR